MVASLHKNFTVPSDGPNRGDTVIAQYIVAKVSWWGTYPRILVVTASTLSTYNPETFQCTNQWDIADIKAVENSPTKHGFVFKFEKSRIRSIKSKFISAGRGHLLSLVARLRRQAQGNALLYRLVSARTLYFRCIEKYANGSSKLLFLQITVSSIIFLDDCGRRVQILPFLYLRMAAFSTKHCEGMVLSTAFHDRFFLCAERLECLNEIVAAATDAGVELSTTPTQLTALQLWLHSTQLLDRASVVRYDVKKATLKEGKSAVAPENNSSDGGKKAYQKIQLILQGDCIVEMHCCKRTVIARPYRALLAIVRPDWDSRMLVLEFKQEQTLLLDVDDRDQMIIMLLLVCREAGQHNVVLISSGLNYCRFYHPHTADTATDDGGSGGLFMETFLLRRITQTSQRVEDSNLKRRRGSSAWFPRRRRSGPRASQGSNDTAKSDISRRSGWFQRQMNKRAIEPLYDMRHSIDSEMFMNEGLSITMAMEELNANLPLEALSRSGLGLANVVNKAMKLVFEHLVMLVTALRRFGDTTSLDLITSLQALVRLYHHPDACFPDELIPQLLDTVHELILQQDTLPCYWCVRLLQCLLGIRTPNTAPGCNPAGDQRARTIQHLIQHATLQHTIVNLIPAASVTSNSSSMMTKSSAIGASFWADNPEVECSPPSSLSSTQPSTLFMKKTGVRNKINVLFYDVLLTLHQLLVYLQSAAKEQRMARGRLNHIAASNWQEPRKNDSDDVPADKQTDMLARKLLEKHEYLMDSIVDIRLVRTAETSVALVKFVLKHFANKTIRDFYAAPSTCRPSHSRDGDLYDTQKRRLGALKVFLYDYHNVIENKTDSQSVLFCSERTIEMPIHAFSNDTSQYTNEAMEKLLNPGSTGDGFGTVISNGSMRLEYLNSSEPSTSVGDDKKAVEPGACAKAFQKNHGVELVERLYKASCKIKDAGRTQPKQQAKYDRNDNFGPHNTNQVMMPSLRAPVKRLNDPISPTQIDCRAVEANLFKIDDIDDAIDPVIDISNDFTAACLSQTNRKRIQSSNRNRQTCDACIGCNDVCAMKACFFCAEKEYNLSVAFTPSAKPATRQVTWQQRTPSSVKSSFSIEREFSSCEMKRHRSQRSCWIRVNDSVFDVTSLLEIHPGEAYILLEAAKHGGDCGLVLRDHLPDALKTLMQYRLGRYYQCITS